MGLRTTHGCWSGPCTSFNQWRRHVAGAAFPGFDLERMIEWGGTHPWPDPSDPLRVLMVHSDCEGQIDVDDLIPIADRLDALVPRLEEISVAAAARQFSAGLRLAASLGEPVEFH